MEGLEPRLDGAGDALGGEALGGEAAFFAKDRQSLCVEILIEGHPAAFCDFFRVTHPTGPAGGAARGGRGPAGAEGARGTGRDAFGATQGPDGVGAVAGTVGGADAGEQAKGAADEAGGVTGEAANDAGELAADALEYIKDNLVAADVARRHGDGGTVVGSYTNLARFFEGRRDYGGAVRYLGEARRAALEARMAAEALEATAALGEAHAHLGDYAAAAKHHERALAMAGAQTRSTPLAEQTARAVQLNLVGVYRALADAAEQGGEMERAVGLLHSCLGAARAGGDRAAEGQANHRLGLAHEALGQPREAMRFHMAHKEICNELGDAAGEGTACAALARTNQELGDVEGAISNLEQFLEISKHGDPELQARACNSLGAIYQHQGKYERAVTYFERGFEVARSLSDRALLDVARVNLGVARGKARMPNYFNAVNTDLLSLLLFKSVRMELS